MLCCMGELNVSVIDLKIVNKLQVANIRLVLSGRESKEFGLLGGKQDMVFLAVI